MLVVSIVGCDPPDLTINIIGEGSTTGAGTYNEGIVVPITATPTPGWTFDGWTGDVANPNSSTTTVTMNGNKTVTANFGHPVTTNNLTIYIIGEGSTTGAGTYNEGTVVTITATPPDYGYVFDGWTGDAVADPNSATTTITMDDDKTVTANFFYLC